MPPAGSGPNGAHPHPDDASGGGSSPVAGLGDHRPDPRPPSGPPGDLEDQVEEVVLRLLIRFGDRVPRADLEQLVRQAASGFTDVRIRSFVPILIEHQAADWVHAVLRRPGEQKRGLEETG